MEYWKKTIQYRRIIEVLKDYWTSEKDELYVKADLTFLKANGEYQKKSIGWFNPDYEVIRTEEEERKLLEDSIIPLDVLLNPPKPEDFIPYLKQLREGKIRKKRPGQTGRSL